MFWEIWYSLILYHCRNSNSASAITKKRKGVESLLWNLNPEDNGFKINYNTHSNISNFGSLEFDG